MTVLPLQQTRSWPYCTHLQHSAGETDGSLTSAETDMIKDFMSLDINQKITS